MLELLLLFVLIAAIFSFLGNAVMPGGLLGAVFVVLLLWLLLRG